MIAEAAALGAVAAQLAPLAAQFLRERKNERDAVTDAEFRHWLQEQAFPLLLQQSSQALQTMVSMKASDTERYAKLEELLLEIRSAVTPSGSEPPPLSDQARSILTQIIRSGSAEMIAVPNLDGASYLLDGNRNLVFDSRVFLADDLALLVRHDYLSQDVNARGAAVYRPTRRGAAYVDQHATPAD